jgi:hypothetical protein
MIARVTGTVVNVGVFNPRPGDKGKACQIIQVLQLTDNNSELIKVKDESFDSRYEAGTKFDQNCFISNWSMGDRDGMSVRVFRGVQSELPVFGSQSQKPKLAV